MQGAPIWFLFTGVGFLQKTDGSFEDDVFAWVQGGCRWDLVTVGDRAASGCSVLGCLAGWHALLPPVDITLRDVTRPFPVAPG